MGIFPTFSAAIPRLCFDMRVSLTRKTVFFAKSILAANFHGFSGFHRIN